METEFVLAPKTGSFNVPAVETHLRGLAPSVFEDPRPNPNPAFSGNRWLVCGEQVTAKVTRAEIDAGDDVGRGIGVLHVDSKTISGWQGGTDAVVEQMQAILTHIAGLHPLQIFNGSGQDVTTDGVAGLYAP